MRLHGWVACVVVGVVVSLAVGVGWAQYGGTSTTPMLAQANGAGAAPKGVKTSALMTSLGAFRQAAAIPVVLTGQVVELAPGGQTGDERFLVPSFLYVLDGTLTTETKGGPVGVAGVQYHAAGQSFSDPEGIWHNHKNGTAAPVKYLLVFIATPGGPNLEKAKAE